MTLYFSISIGIIISYAAFLLYFYIGLIRLKNIPLIKNNYKPTVSVVVAARNEARNIRHLLEGLSQQTYPIEKLQIIIADDRSSDKTGTIINDFAKKHTNFLGINISEPSKTMTPKKYALTKAIEKSTGEIIISTDADCRVPNTWVESAVNLFDEETGIILGYSRVDTGSDSLLDHYQSIDFLALMSANAGTVGWDNPWTGTGQNIAYRRSAFDKIGGFTPVAKQISGDDFYLVQAISKIAKVKYNTNSDNFVTTKPLENILKFISQRIRWASNSRKLFNSDYFFLLFLFINLFTNTILLSTIILQSLWQYLPMFFGIKFLFDSLVLFSGSKIFNTNIKISVYLIWFFLQPLYTPILAVFSLIGKFRWKV